LCQLSADVHVTPRTDNSANGETTSSVSAQSVVYLPESGQVARLLSTSQVPKFVIPEGKILVVTNDCSLFCPVNVFED